MRYLILVLGLSACAHAKPVVKPPVVPKPQALPTTIDRDRADQALIAFHDAIIAKAEADRAKAIADLKEIAWKKVVVALKTSYNIDVEAGDGWDDVGDPTTLKLRRGEAASKKP